MRWKRNQKTNTLYLYSGEVPVASVWYDSMGSPSITDRWAAALLVESRSQRSTEFRRAAEQEDAKQQAEQMFREWCTKAGLAPINQET